MFHVKHITYKILFSLFLLNCNSPSYSKNRIDKNPNTGSELPVQEQLIEEYDLDITLYFIEDNNTLDIPTKTIINEISETLKEIGKGNYVFTGNSNIKEDTRKAERRSRRKATWLCHQIKITGLNAEISVKGNGLNEPEIENPKYEWQNQLNSNIKIKTN